METEPISHDAGSIDGAASSPSVIRDCSPSEQGDRECNQEELADIATEVTIRASGEPSVSSLICSGLQTIHGAPEKEQPERAWEEETYEEQQIHQLHQECSNEVGESNSNMPLQHDQMLEPYTMPIQVNFYNIHRIFIG